jgi:hypothetical protein
MSDQPLIHTTKGNLPIESLAYSHKWEKNPDYIKFTETYKLGDEIVRESVHVLGIKPLEACDIQQGMF